MYLAESEAQGITENYMLFFFIKFMDDLFTIVFLGPSVLKADE